jgi:hypothetical protein
MGTMSIEQRSLTLLPVRKSIVTHHPYIWLAVLQAIDVATTWCILNYWSVRSEGNPLVAEFLNSVGLPVGMLTFLALKLATVYILWICQTGTKFALSIYSLIAVNNIMFLVLWLIS